MISKGTIIIDKIDTSEVQTIKAEYNDAKCFNMDEKGYFLIRIVDDLLEVGFCEELNKVKFIIRGKKPVDIYTTILRKGIIDKPDHAAYLGRELQKAYIAMKEGIPYVQDSELVFQND